jgi:hypothetical protein
MFKVSRERDVIVRTPFGEDKNYVALGVVSKSYTFIPHNKIVDTVERALEGTNIPAGEMSVRMQITEHGERMSLNLLFPARYNFDPGDGHPMGLLLTCMNSVDGSARFRALMGWFRFVCSNGLIIGVTRIDVRRRHIGELNAGSVEDVLKKGTRLVDTERQNLVKWLSVKVPLNRIEVWADSHLRAKLGFKAAARVCLIARSGYDGDTIGDLEDSKPSRICMERTAPVPGAPESSDNLFDISQILAWLARNRRDLQEQIKWLENIPALMEPLLSLPEVRGQLDLTDAGFSSAATQTL